MADLLDVIEYETCRAAVGALTAQQALVEACITAVSRMLDERCGPIVRRTVTDELHAGGHPSIELRLGPVYAFTSVIEAQGTDLVTLTQQTFGTQPADGYLAEPHATDTAVYSGLLRRMSGGSKAKFWPGENTVKVTYTGGRYTNTAAVDARFKRAGLLCFRQMWRAEQQGVVSNPDGYPSPSSAWPGFALPNAVKELLADELRLPGLA